MQPYPQFQKVEENARLASRGGNRQFLIKNKHTKAIKMLRPDSTEQCPIVPLDSIPKFIRCQKSVGSNTKKYSEADTLVLAKKIDETNAANQDDQFHPTSLQSWFGALKSEHVQNSFIPEFSKSG